MRVTDVSAFTLIDDGTLDTVIRWPDGEEWRYSQELASEYRNEDGALDLDRFLAEVVIPAWEDYGRTG